MGSVISSTTLKCVFGTIVKGRGLYVFSNNTCLSGSLSNKTLIHVTIMFDPKLIENSLK